MKQLLQNNPSQDLENSLLKRGYKRIIGIDEAGRGCWAGPVAIAAYIFSFESKTIQGIKDSKLLSENKRKTIFESFEENSFKVLLKPASEVDSIGISKVIENAIIELIEIYNEPSTFFLIDGRFSKIFPGANKQIIKGDRLHYSIAAASIAAKVTRDNLMVKLDEVYPGYEFSKHKGYGTQLHLASINKLGQCAIHRQSFEPLKSLNAKQKPKSWENRGKTCD